MENAFVDRVLVVVAPVKLGYEMLDSPSCWPVGFRFVDLVLSKGEGMTNRVSGAFGCLYEKRPRRLDDLINSLLKNVSDLG